MTKIEDDENLRIQKVRVTDKNGPQIWTMGKILIKRRYLDNGAIVQCLTTILRVAEIFLTFILIYTGIHA